MPEDAKFDPRIMAVYKHVAELVGIDGPRDELVKWLSNKVGESTHTHHKVVSIVGYGGLGKTTLAKQIYDKLEANFECRAFVSISRSPDMRTIFSSLLSEISNGREHARESAQQIIDQIREFLKHKRYATFLLYIR
jgi:chromosomal replication initiation ATPase DnaA